LAVRLFQQRLVIQNLSNALIAQLLAELRFSFKMVQLPHNHRNWMGPYAITLEIVTTILLWVRLISRFSTKKLGVDDLFITIAWAVAIGHTVMLLVGEYSEGN
jgi:hypothetical protein